MVKTSRRPLFVLKSSEAKAGARSEPFWSNISILGDVLEHWGRLSWTTLPTLALTPTPCGRIADEIDPQEPRKESLKEIMGLGFRGLHS